MNVIRDLPTAEFGSLLGTHVLDDPLGLYLTWVPVKPTNTNICHRKDVFR
jgi:hypothetical protein